VTFLNFILDLYNNLEHQHKMSIKSLADFGCVHVINLAERTDRRDEISQQLALVDLSFKSPNVKLFDAIRPTHAGGFDSIGAKGCFMSHLGVLRESISLDNVLILEDDLDFVSNIKIRAQTALEQLPDDWGIFYGGCPLESRTQNSSIVQISPSTPITTAHFVAFNGQAIVRLVSYLDAILQRPAGHIDGGPMHVDGAYSRFRADNPDVSVFAAVPELGYQRSSRTDIHSLKWFDRLPLVKQSVQLLRRRRANIRRKSA
jgi:glycosyl transferase, family 25